MFAAESSLIYVPADDAWRESPGLPASANWKPSVIGEDLYLLANVDGDFVLQRLLPR